MNENKKPSERIYSANEYENKDKNNEFQTSNNFTEEEKLKIKDDFNDENKDKNNEFQTSNKFTEEEKLKNKDDFNDENKDKNNEFQINSEFNEEELKKEIDFNDNDLIEWLDKLKNFNFNDDEIVVWLDKFKNFNFKRIYKIIIIKYYINYFINPKIHSLFFFFLKELQDKSTNIKFSINDYSFKFLIKNMSTKLKAINTFFDILK